MLSTRIEREMLYYVLPINYDYTNCIYVLGNVCLLFYDAFEEKILLPMFSPFRKQIADADPVYAGRCGGMDLSQIIRSVASLHSTPI